MTARPIVFLSDFGYRNEWVGICQSVIARVAPASHIIDLSHGVPPLDVRAGALLLPDSSRFLPEDAIVLAVVDPSVGSDRDVAIETEHGPPARRAGQWAARVPLAGRRRRRAGACRSPSSGSCCSRSRRRSTRVTCSRRQRRSWPPAARSRSSAGARSVRRWPSSRSRRRPSPRGRSSARCSI